MYRRTPKHFDGTSKTAKTLSDLLPEILKEIGAKGGVQEEEIFLFFLELIGAKMKALTEPVSFTDGVLTVKVKSQALYSLLVQHERPRLLKELQKRFTVRNLVFRIG